MDTSLASSFNFLPSPLSTLVAKISFCFSHSSQCEVKDLQLSVSEFQLLVGLSNRALVLSIFIERGKE
ncbi:hypothetical protein MTR67_011974 [Solanum verrucosum]|uniref:Uncharacterized protein n=1 Tax=Solanum verrucosum TaxID=315347 RepID=A0AAF0QEV5_SOLVR|nr:hypothetical protein MTR67_011974 [Solanum verrucosum]